MADTQVKLKPPTTRKLLKALAKENRGLLTKKTRGEIIDMGLTLLLDQR